MAQMHTTSQKDPQKYIVYINIFRLTQNGHDYVDGMFQMRFLSGYTLIQMSPNLVSNGPIHTKQLWVK